MASDPRPDVFVNFHKGLRRGLLGLSVLLGSLNWSDPEEVEAVSSEFTDLLWFLRKHDEGEKHLPLTAIEEQSPGAIRQMREEHLKLEIMIDRLEEAWAKVLQNPAPASLGYDFYMDYNRFLSTYLSHMELEEKEVTEAIYRHFTDDQVDDVFGRIIARITPQDMALMMRYILPGINHDEREEFLKKIKISASQDVFMGVQNVAQKVLAPEEWEKLSEQIRLG